MLDSLVQKMPFCLSWSFTYNTAFLCPSYSILPFFLFYMQCYPSLSFITNNAFHRPSVATLHSFVFYIHSRLSLSFTFNTGFPYPARALLPFIYRVSTVGHIACSKTVACPGWRSQTDPLHSLMPLAVSPQSIPASLIPCSTSSICFPPSCLISCCPEGPAIYSVHRKLIACLSGSPSPGSLRSSDCHWSLPRHYRPQTWSLLRE